MTPSPPLVSVLVPIYNHARYVETCLTSVRDCGYAPLELVLLDDGSTDGSFEVAQAWLRAHSDVFERVLLSRQENQGIPATLNRLVAQASGEFVTLLASDDLLLPGGIATRVKALLAAPDRMAVIGDCTVVDGEDCQVFASGIRDLRGGFKPALRRARYLQDELVIRWSVPGPAFLARRSLYDSEIGIGPYDETVGVEDRDFYLRLLKRNLLTFIDVPVAAYRVHDRNAFKQPERRLNLLKSMLIVEQRHLGDFNGLARTAMWLRANHYRATIRRESTDGLIWHALSRLLHRSLGWVHLLHILLVLLDVALYSRMKWLRDPLSR